MTITAQYTPASFLVNDKRSYTFTFEYVDPSDITVYEMDSNDTLTVVSPTRYTLTTEGEVPLYDRGTVAFPAAHTAGTISVVVERNTNITQLTNYQPYSAFPAETHEFALDKLTMIAQEQATNTGRYQDGGGGTPVTGDFIPLSGTVAGKPVAGNVRWSKDSGNTAWEMAQGNLFGVNTMTINSDSPTSQLAITTQNDGAQTNSFQFTKDGQLLIPSFGANNEVWAFQGSDFGASQNALGVYSLDQDTGNRTENPMFFYTSGTQAVSFDINGKVTVTGLVTAGDNEQVLTTKKYVDDAISGSGSLPPSAPGEILIGDQSAGWTKASHMTLDEVTVGGQGNISLTGVIGQQNLDTAGTFMYTSVRNVTGGHAYVIAGTGVNSSVNIAPEGFLQSNSFLFSNGFLALPNDPTDDTHAATKKYVDDTVSGGSGDLPSGTANQTMRHNGTSWEATSVATLTSGGNLEITGQLTTGTSIACGGTLAVGSLGAATGGDTLLVNGDFGVLADSGIVYTDVPLKSAYNVFDGTNVFGLGVVASPSSAGIPSYRFAADENTGIYQYAEGIVGISGNGLNGARFTGQGAVIGQGGSVNPTTGTPLIVNGSINASLPASTSTTNVVWGISGNIGYYASDARLKTDVEPSEYGLNQILSLNPVDYTEIATGERQTGFIAQEVKGVVPRAVNYPHESAEYLALSDRPLVAALVNAVKELTARIEELENA